MTKLKHDNTLCSHSGEVETRSNIRSCKSRIWCCSQKNGCGTAPGAISGSATNETRLGPLPNDRQTLRKMRLSDKQRDELQALIGHSCVDQFNPQENVLQLASAARSSCQRILQDLQIRFLMGFRTPAANTAILIQNLPIGYFGPTPLDGLRPRTKCLTSEAVMLGIAAIIGYPIGYLNEKNGEIIQQIVPIDSQTTENSNGSRRVFGFHSDNNFLKPQFRQEVIGLLGLRNPSGAATLLLDLPDLINAMPEELFNWSMKPNCRFLASKSFEMGGKLLYTEPRPLLYPGHDGLLRINANTYQMRGVSPVDDKMIEEFVKLTQLVKHHRIIIQPGELLLFHDDFALHGREPFEGDRWLQRIYVRFDLDRLWSIYVDRTTRVFDAKRLYFE